MKDKNLWSLLWIILVTLGITTYNMVCVEKLEERISKLEKACIECK